MLLIRILTLPILPFYALVVLIRNWSYDKGVLKSNSFDIPVIGVGNLSVGGTGKTPMVEYIIRLLNQENKVAVISRGYGRKTKGFVFAEKTSTSTDVGDEPLQFKKKFEHINVAVCAKRVKGINNIIKQFPETQTILLDDAFQHRSVTPGISCLLYTSPSPRD